jgi:hypothetical protein
LELFKQLPLGAFCLYKTWLLLSEVFDFDSFLDADDAFILRQGGASSVHAVASRHWYKTACTFSKELYASAGIHDSLVALRLPGSYSTRGDWFLGYTKSSRSRLLAEHAIDLMSSRRGNITRLQRGLGLPVRDFVGDGKCGEFRTALLCMMEKSANYDKQISSPIDFLPYGELCKLGKIKKNSELEWLFRSRIQDYDRLSRPLQKWLARVFRWSGDRKRAGRHGLKGGFAAYDDLTCKCPSNAGYEGFEEFGEMCDFLKAALIAAKRGAGAGGDPITYFEGMLTLGMFTRSRFLDFNCKNGVLAYGFLSKGQNNIRDIFFRQSFSPCGFFHHENKTDSFAGIPEALGYA